MSRTVIVSHSHPNLRYGGGEVAAYRQFEHLLSLDEDVFFVGSTITHQGPGRARPRSRPDRGPPRAERSAAEYRDLRRRQGKLHAVVARSGSARLRPFPGRYRPQDCVEIMRSYGWIIIPSVWWENSPVVIQKARAAGTPMIASDIGGMAEKTAGWGIQFRVGDPAALAAAILSVAGRPEALIEQRSRITPPLTMAEFMSEWAEACRLERQDPARAYGSDL